MKQKKFWALAGILLSAVAVSIYVGRYPLTLQDLWAIFTGTEKGMGQRVFLQIRLPRTFLVLFCGAALSVSGMIYQHIFRNPLVSPDVLGVTSGASVGAAFAILLGGRAQMIGISAFGAGLLAVLFTMALARAVGGQPKVSLLISGIVTGAMSGAFLMLMKYAADPAEQLPSIDYWLMGSFHTAGWKDVRLTVPVVCLSTAVLWAMRWKLSILALGDEEAKTLGLGVEKVRIGATLLATLLVAAVVSVAGTVSWVGLIVPHLIRLIWGGDLRESFGPCILGGAAFLLIADLIARSLTAAEIPVSILTSLSGAVLLAILLIQSRRKGGWL